MSQNTGLTTIHEDDIEKHLPTAHSMVTRLVILETDDGRSGTALAGTGRRFVSTVSTGSTRRTRQVELEKTIAAVRPGDQMLSIAQHTLLFRARRGLAVALALTDVFAQQSDLETLQSRNRASPLSGDEAVRFKALLAASSYVAAFGFAAYLSQLLDGEVEPAEDVDEPDFHFDTPQDALKSMVSALDGAIAGAPDDTALTARAQGLRTHRRSKDCCSARARFTGLAHFAQVHIRIDSDDFTLDGFDVAPGEKAQAAGDELQEAERDHRQPHRQVPGDASSPRC